MTDIKKNKKSDINRFIYKLHNLLNSKENSNSFYNLLMLSTIIISLCCLAFKKDYKVIQLVDIITALIFIIDYILRWITADIDKKKGVISFLLYPITPWAIVDIISILPSFRLLSRTFRIFKVLRISRLLKSLRIIKLARFSKEIQLLIAIWQKEKKALISFGYLAAGYIFITALIIFNIEPETFNSFFDAIYWATVSLTTVGYGDIYAVSVTGKIITMISSLFGIALIAMPASIITAGLLDEIKEW